MKRYQAAGFTAIMVALAAASVAFAGDDATSLSYISYLERYATLRPAQSQEALDAVVNMPVLTGDRLDTSRSARIEVQLADGSTVWVDEFSTLDFDSLALSRDNPAEKTALYLSQGTVAVEIPPTAAGSGTIRFDSPAGTLYLDQPGLFRIDLSGSEVHVQAYSGLAELPVGVGSALLRGGEEASLDQGGSLQKASLSEDSDDFWNWVQERRHPTSTGATAQYVDSHDAGRAAVLDNYGDWVYEPSFSSWMWRPHVGAGWVPYSDGRWAWTPVGWTWISYEPWGWYPFHYGSWYLSAEFGWVWGWDSVWSPAWVYWMYTPGYVGWCPRGYYDWWYYHQYRGEAGHRFPSRWNDVTFDFSGRVRLGKVDPQPWTFVPTSQFNSTNVERTRLEPGRFLREVPGDRTGIVRSGPMLTQVPSRTSPERTIETFFRQGTSLRQVPDLTSVLRREPATGPGMAGVDPILTPSRTNDLTNVPRVRIENPPVRLTREVEGGRWTIRNTDGKGVQVNSGREVRQVDRTVVRSQDSNPPPVVRREVERPAPSTERVAPPPPPREVARPERPPAASRQRNDSVSYLTDREWGGQGVAARSATRVIGTPYRTEVQNRTYNRRVVAEPRIQPRSIEARREVAPVRTFRSVGSAPSSFARSSPVTRSSTASSAPHFSSAPRSVSVARPRR